METTPNQRLETSLQHHWNKSFHAVLVELECECLERRGLLTPATVLTSLERLARATSGNYPLAYGLLRGADIKVCTSWAEFEGVLEGVLEDLLDEHAASPVRGFFETWDEGHCRHEVRQRAGDANARATPTAAASVAVAASTTAFPPGHQVVRGMQALWNRIAALELENDGLKKTAVRERREKTRIQQELDALKRRKNPTPEASVIEHGNDGPKPSKNSGPPAECSELDADHLMDEERRLEAELASTFAEFQDLAVDTANALLASLRTSGKELVPGGNRTLRLSCHRPQLGFRFSRHHQNGQ
ncbi:hypothetical protein GTA08_BOTSDO04802 [Botryosphaeria dothidea]|uniref:Uncharacterized protein n=1 Tax=Botryosphaeria dothidea TaxID=55169 RepID=A0A8H4N624_9PEZI|nr:hypothetical protein GTA08_BOTSDO04802 [Botryosphaeria dothidea]